jgi:hypothetical protein
LESIAEAAASFVSPVIDGPSSIDSVNAHGFAVLSFARFILPDVRGLLLASPLASLSKRRMSNAK